MWLNDKEEEEVNFDWSDRNTNMTAKKDNYSVGLWCLSVPLDFSFRYIASREKHDFALININIIYSNFPGSHARAGAEGEEGQ